MQLKSPMNLILGLKKAHYCAMMHASLPNSRAAVPRKNAVTRKDMSQAE